jgi:hypothetical protein
MSTFITYGGLTNEEISKQVLYLGIDGVSTFQGVKSRVIVLMRTQQTFYFIGIYYMVD